MSQIRILATEELDRLETVEDGFVPNAEHTVVIIAEENGKIVGRTMLMDAVHIEGTWVHPEYRGGTVGHRLMRKLQEEARSRGISRLIAYSASTTDDYMARLGFRREPYTVWVKDI